MLNSDGSFNKGKENFSSTSTLSGSEKSSFTWNNAFSVSSTKATDETHNVKLTHTLAVVKDSKYTICFDAKSTTDGLDLAFVVDMGGKIGADTKPDYSELSGWLSAKLSTTYKTIPQSFTAKASNDTARLVFNVGKTTAGIAIDNIAVYAGEVSCPVISAPVANTANGKSTYTSKCVNCHGASGTGATPINSSRAFYSEGGNANEYSMSTFIANFMPDNGNVGTCIGQCAVDVAAYIKGGFQ